MTYLWIPALPIRVMVRDGQPVAFRWRGHRHRVETITRQWRVDVAWWQARIWRDYFKLMTQTGLLVVIYRDRLSGDWYLQQLFD